ncbi:DUF1223 domain-containing protein [Tautonia plasticadhaerens]|nr:DUF1223 domain-containing protein [Tautonia plasticadhaerens]
MILRLLPAAILALVGPEARAQPGTSGVDERRVLVELFTSQGCNMCPEAEEILGDLGDADGQALTVAFHVDYFNEPWEDPFSETLYSRRQWTYNELYTKPKNPEYGLYYTPMMMVDGVQTVNGRDPRNLRLAVKAARSRPPLVSIDAELTPGAEPGSADLRVAVSPLSSRVVGRELLVCAVLRDDRVATEVPSGENAGKTLVNRYPARKTEYEFATLEDDRTASESAFSFKVAPGLPTDRLGLVVFVQDRKTGAVCQSAFVPWALPGTKADESEAVEPDPGATPADPPGDEPGPSR